MEDARDSIDEVALNVLLAEGLDLPSAFEASRRESGARVPVESLFDCLKHGRTIDYFLEQFPTVKREQVEQLLDEAKANTLSRSASA